MRWFRRQSQGLRRSELIDRKHRLEGEIRSLSREVERRRSAGRDVADMEARLASLQYQHHQTRLAIDRTGH